MSQLNDLYSSEFLNDNAILIGKIKKPSITKEEANQILDFVKQDIQNYPDHQHFILDVLLVQEVSNPIIGVLMKALQFWKKTRGYALLVMTDDLLQKIMIEQPAMFDFFAVFHTVDEAIAFTKKA
jgi:hypothetical protein